MIYNVNTNVYYVEKKMLINVIKKMQTVWVFKHKKTDLRKLD